MLNRLARQVTMLSTCIWIMFASLTTSISHAGTVHQVEIYQFKFVPDVVDIEVGDSIVWTNKDIVPHTATALDKSWDTGEILTGESKSVSFHTEADLAYYCLYHPTMKASVRLLTN